MTRFIDDHREQFGVQPICDVLGWNVSTYYAHRRRPPSERALRDDHLAIEVRRVFEANYRVYGYRKVHSQLTREGFRVAECTVRRLMRREGLTGAVRGWKKPRTTTSDNSVVRPPDLLDRDFTAAGPDRRWVADLTYVRLTTGRFVYAAVIADVFSRNIVGWAVADHLRTELPLTARRQALWERRHVDLDGLIHHGDAGGQYVAARYGEELAAARIVPSIGSVGDSYDNAMAESTIGLVKTELVHNPTRGPWSRLSSFEFALAEYIDWFNNARLHGELDHRTPTEIETDYYRHHTPAPLASIHS
jgi:putative transposase